MCTLLIKKIQAVLWIKRHLLNKSIATWETQIQAVKQTALLREHRKAWFVKAKSTKCDSFMQLKDCC